MDQFCADIQLPQRRTESYVSSHCLGSIMFATCLETAEWKDFRYLQTRDTIFLLVDLCSITASIHAVDYLEDIPAK